jgi:hypothetical protein
MTPPEPRTAAGRELWLDGNADVDLATILAIEAEAASLGGEALRAALERLVNLDDEWGEKPEPESAWALAKEQARAALTPVAKDE